MHKRPTANDRLNKKSGLYFSIGLFISMLLIVTAFEWKTYVIPFQFPDEPGDAGVFIMDPVITRHKIPERPKPKIKVPEKEIAVAIQEIEKDLKEIPIDLPVIDYKKNDPVPDIKIEDEPVDVHFAGTLEVEPSFKGGLEAFYRYIGKNIKYINRNIEGTVVLSFIINKEGRIKNIEVIKKLDEALDKEAIRVLENSPLWSPGQQRGNPVKVRMKIPISFGLQK